MLHSDFGDGSGESVERKSVCLGERGGVMGGGRERKDRDEGEGKGRVRKDREGK